MTVIRAQDIAIKFNVRFMNERLTLRRSLMSFVQGLRNGGRGWSTKFWALNGVSFEIAKGETVGLIGHNGAGKSTLLKVLAGIYHPDRGSVETHGKIGTLLSLGGGFNNEMTGRENIELNGLLMGLSRQEIGQKSEQITQFSELGKFIDAPLKTYSAGMRARLGFSIAISIDPDIVLLDEVLEAGDAAFSRKAGNLLAFFKEQGKTVVIASHNLPIIQFMCSRALLLDHGRLLADGPAQEVVAKYQTSVQ